MNRDEYKEALSHIKKLRKTLTGLAMMAARAQKLSTLDRIATRVADVAILIKQIDAK